MEKEYFDKFGSGTINGHEYVDLGLTVKWATCNVGASTSEDYGDYFAWGEITPKEEYIEDNSVTYGKEMKDIAGDPSYDAATANWGSTWRLPTIEEIQELIDNCKWECATYNGVNGMLVKSKKNGNSIFLPAACYCDGSSLYGNGLGYYWGSSPNESGTLDACYLGFYRKSFARIWFRRYRGHSVRPVSK